MRRARGLGGGKGLGPDLVQVNSWWGYCGNKKTEKTCHLVAPSKFVMNCSTPARGRDTWK